MSYRRGLGETYDMAVPGPNAGLQSLQNKLFRAGLLTSGSFEPGRWDTATAAAVNAAAARLGYQTVGCADCAPGNAFATRAMPDQRVSIFVDLLALLDTLPPVQVSTAFAASRSKTPWLLIGAGVVVVGGAAAYFLLRKPKALSANRRRRHRR